MPPHKMFKINQKKKIFLLKRTRSYVSVGHLCRIREGGTHLPVSVFFWLLLVFPPQVMYQVCVFCRCRHSRHFFLMSRETKLPFLFRLEQFKSNFTLLSMWPDWPPTLFMLIFNQPQWFSFNHHKQTAPHVVANLFFSHWDAVLFLDTLEFCWSLVLVKLNTHQHMYTCESSKYIFVGHFSLSLTPNYSCFFCVTAKGSKRLWLTRYAFKCD